MPRLKLTDGTPKVRQATANPRAACVVGVGARGGMVGGEGLEQQRTRSSVCFHPLSPTNDEE